MSGADRGARWALALGGLHWDHLGGREGKCTPAGRPGLHEGPECDMGVEAQAGCTP